MRLDRTLFVRTFSAIFAASVLMSCNEETLAPSDQDHVVAISVNDGRTRTQMQSDGLSAVWENGDVLSLWAYNSHGSFILTDQPFTAYGIDSSRGFFTSSLASPMPSGTYTYWCTYPRPDRVNGINALFEIPSVQDGKVSGGADIMIATPVQGGALKSIGEEHENASLSLRMNHMLHQFRFYIPHTDELLSDRELERIIAVFPKSVAGKVEYNLMNPSVAPVLSEGESQMELRLAEPIGRSTDSAFQYACMAFLPSKFDSGQMLYLKAYTDNKIAEIVPVDLRAREFQAGHSTPVALKVTEIHDYCRIRFIVGANNIGENVKSVTLTAPAGCVLGESGSNEYIYDPGYEFSAGETFEIVFEDVDAYRALSGKTLTLNYDTEHVKTQQTIVLPQMTQGHLVEIGADVPYLLYEDFSAVQSFSSNDTYTGGSNSGSKSASSFLNGWTAARAGAQAGKAIRIACRRETSANYSARVDSRPIISLKKSSDIKVTFNYGMSNQYGGITITPADFGQKVHLGYVTSTTAYKSGDDDGVFEAANSFDLHEGGGSYDSMMNLDTFTLKNIPTGTVRITWRTTPHSDAGLTNTTCWLYIDNVIVQIAR